MRPPWCAPGKVDDWCDSVACPCTLRNVTCAFGGSLPLRCVPNDGNVGDPCRSGTCNKTLTCHWHEHVCLKGEYDLLNYGMWCGFSNTGLRGSSQSPTSSSVSVSGNGVGGQRGRSQPEDNSTVDAVDELDEACKSHDICLYESRMNSSLSQTQRSCTCHKQLLNATANVDVMCASAVSREACVSYVLGWDGLPGMRDAIMNDVCFCDLGSSGGGVVAYRNALEAPC